jgi:multicomponent Na+:H+ antiporter subunit F
MMIAPAGAFLQLAVVLAFALLLGGMGFALWRLVIGPTLPDRVVALDMMTILMVAFTALYAIASGEDAFLDIAIALALVAFLATVALARYAERRMRQESARAEGGS